MRTASGSIDLFGWGSGGCSFSHLYGGSWLGVLREGSGQPTDLVVDALTHLMADEDLMRKLVSLRRAPPCL